MCMTLSNRSLSEITVVIYDGVDISGKHYTEDNGEMTSDHTVIYNNVSINT